MGFRFSRDPSGTATAPPAAGDRLAERLRAVVTDDRAQNPVPTAGNQTTDAQPQMEQALQAIAAELHRMMKDKA
jgi:hypothetical protein